MFNFPMDDILNRIAPLRPQTYDAYDSENEPKAWDAKESDASIPVCELSEKSTD